MANISKFLFLLAIAGLSFDRCSIAADEDSWDPHFTPEDLPPITPRIVNGYRSTPDQRPFFAKAGYDQYYFTNEILCGASIIWHDILVTAAHCQGAFNSGALILDSNTNDYTLKVPIDRQSRHPGWSISRNKLNYDVLVMRLATPLTDSDAAKPISINISPDYPKNRQELKAYGFGLTEDQIVSDHLREAGVTYISNDECFGRGITFNNVLKSTEVMCTDPYADRTATCLGDSGGPLTDSSGSTLVGIISFGSGCEADHIPDGHVRLSEVSDWVQEQICLLSANPPASCGDRVEQRDQRSVEVVIDFTHDFYPEHTSFSVQSKKTLKNVYAGPQYIPKRNGNHEESLFLLPGEYTFDVYDTEGDGLVSSMGDGSWKLSALYDGCTKTEIATGGHSFKNQQVTRFVVSDRTVSNGKNCGGNPMPSTNANPTPGTNANPTPNTDGNPTQNTDGNPTPIVDSLSELNECVKKKDAESIFGTAFSTTCDCFPNASSGAIELECFDPAGKTCAYLYQTCSVSSDCCSGRRCVDGQCRSMAPTITNRDTNKIGGTSTGGAAARTARGAGNLRRR